MARTFLKLSLTLGVLALSSMAVLAASHPVGPFSKAQLAKLCRSESAKLTTAPGSWMCEAHLWTIDCVENGRLCVIDLFGPLPDGSIGGRTIVASANPGTPDPGTGTPTGPAGAYKIPGPVTGNLGIGPSGNGDALTGVNGAGSSHGGGFQPLPGH